MLKTLKFVAGAIDKKSLAPYMTHFVIKDGRITAYNGVIALSSPISIDIDCKPKADTFIKAISSCTDTISLALTDTGRLRVQSGKFKAFIECFSEESPLILPEGKMIDIDGKQLLKAFNACYKFISDNPMQQWANGVLIDNECVSATNNVVIIEHWIDFTPEKPLVIPRQAVREMIRINEAPETIQIAERSATFQYADGRLIKTQLLENKFPRFNPILDKPTSLEPIDIEIFKALKILKPFVDSYGKIIFNRGLISTSTDSKTGSSYSVDSIDFGGIYNNQMLELLENTALRIDWTQTPALFFGDELRGAIIGMRQ